MLYSKPCWQLSYKRRKNCKAIIVMRKLCSKLLIGSMVLCFYPGFLKKGVVNVKTNIKTNIDHKVANFCGFTARAKKCLQWCHVLYNFYRSSFFFLEFGYVFGTHLHMVQSSNYTELEIQYIKSVWFYFVELENCHWKCFNLTFILYITTILATEEVFF
jgi:hypothetical protein